MALSDPSPPTCAYVVYEWSRSLMSDITPYYDTAYKNTIGFERCLCPKCAWHIERHSYIIVPFLSPFRPFLTESPRSLIPMFSHFISSFHNFMIFLKIVSISIMYWLNKLKLAIKVNRKLPGSRQAVARQFCGHLILENFFIHQISQEFCSHLTFWSKY